MSSRSVPFRVVSPPAPRAAEAPAGPRLGILGRPVVLTFAIGVVTMAIVGATVVILRDIYGVAVGELGRLFDLDAEQNVSTWFQVIQLFSAALLGGLVALSQYRLRDSRWVYWTGIALVLTLFSADELAGFHERISQFVSWLRIGKYFVVVVGLVYLRFWWSLPARFRVLLLAACAIYFGSVMGLEVLSFHYWTPDAAHRLRYAVITVFEETGEMIGAWLFFTTLLAYLRHTGVDLQLRLPR